MRDRPSEAASKPGACGTRSSRAVSAARTIVASRSSGFGLEPELLDHGVEGAALAAMAPEHAVDVEWRRLEAVGDRRHFGRRDEQEHRLGSTKRRMSQGQAMRSIFGRARVTQTVRPASSRGGIFSVFTSGAPVLCQASKPPSSDFGA